MSTSTSATTDPIDPHTLARINNLITFSPDPDPAKDARFELFVWDAGFGTSALLAPMGKGNDLKRAMESGQFNKVLGRLEGAQWFPIGRGISMVRALEDLAGRLSFLPYPFEDHPDISTIWIPSVLTVCDIATRVASQHPSQVTLENTVDAMLARKPLPTSYQKLAAQGPY